MKIKNIEIYTFIERLSALHLEKILFPVRISFYLQKNIKLLTASYEDIVQTRQNLASNYGTLNDDGTAYNIPAEKIQQVQQELNILFNLEQTIDIHLFKLSEFEDIELTYEQLDAIAFMIEE